MKRTILSLLVAVLSVATMSAQETKKASYVIDGKQVENFDGTQLLNKTVVNYTIEPVHNVHVIFTSDYEKLRGKIGSVKVFASESEVKEGKPSTTTSERIIIGDSLSQAYANAYADAVNAEAGSGEKIKITAAKPDEIVYVLDDKVAVYNKIKDLSSSKIASMAVIKDKQSDDYKKYAKEIGRDPKCIIKITTK